MANSIPAAWYPDPDDNGVSERYWNGDDWTEHTRPAEGRRPSDSSPAVLAVQGAGGPHAQPQMQASGNQPSAWQQQPVQWPQAPVAQPLDTGPRFRFDGGAATYVGTGILGFLIVVFTLGICTPFAIVLKHRWKAKHTYIDGRRLIFKGSAIGLFGRFLLWWFLTIITLGVYSFWVIPRLVRWTVQNTDFDQSEQQYTYAR